MTVSVAGLPAEISSLIQDRTLERMFHDALFPRLLFRMEVSPEKWPVNLGERQVFTRTGLIPVKTQPLKPGEDPKPSSYATEQWEAEAAQHGDAIDTHMPTSYVTLASQYLRNTHSLGLNAGETLNRLVRNRLYNAYLAGHASATAEAASGATTIEVSTINGFTEALSGGRLQPVSASNPIEVEFSGNANNVNVVAATPADPDFPLGPGTLTLASGLSDTVARREGVRSVTRSRIIRVGGAATVDGITAANVITLQDVINAVARLRDDKVPPHMDGFYHVHLSPSAEAEIYDDNHFQRLHQSLPDSAAYQDLGIGRLVGSLWYRNTETPDSLNSGDLIDTSGGSGEARGSREIHGDLINDNGVPIRRAIVTGGGAIYEKYLDESKYITEAGVTGKIGSFQITHGGAQVMTERIRFIARSPLDRLQQVYSQAWSWSGDFPVPSDQTTGGQARHKRAIIIEHA